MFSANVFVAKNTSIGRNMDQAPTVGVGVNGYTDFNPFVQERHRLRFEYYGRSDQT